MTLTLAIILAATHLVALGAGWYAKGKFGAKAAAVEAAVKNAEGVIKKAP